MFRRIVPVFVAVFALLPVLAFGQAAITSIAGVVKDSSGAAVPGALVKAVREASPTNSIEAISDEHGSYRIEVPFPGAYEVDAVLDGFEPASQRVVIDLGKAASIDFTLLPARLTEAVVVTARRVEETIQDVPIPVSVVSGTLAA